VIALTRHLCHSERPFVRNLQGRVQNVEFLTSTFILLTAFSGSASDKPARAVAAPQIEAPIVKAEPDAELSEVGPDSDDEPAVLASFLTPPRAASKEELSATSSGNWCKAGHLVMIPDGREGRVTSVDGPICRVLAYGEGYVSIWTYDLVEPVYPQEIPFRNFGH
jgi:hypothetical protein